MKLTDGRKTVEIRLCVWENGGYTPDWSEDFFNAGALQYDEDRDAYIVNDVNYCINQAQDWKDSTGDFSCDEPDENRAVFVEEV